MKSFDPTSASRAVLIEVMNILGAFRDEIVLVGGWVPDLLYPGRGHMGSLDVDLAVSGTATAEKKSRRVYLVWAGATRRGRHVASWPRRKRIVAIWLFIIGAAW